MENLDKIIDLMKEYSSFQVSLKTPENINITITKEENTAEKKIGF